MDSLGIFSRGGNGSRKESLLFLLGCLEAQGSFPAKIQGGVVSTRLEIAPVYFFPKMVRPYGKLILRVKKNGPVSKSSDMTVCCRPRREQKKYVLAS